MKDLDSAEQKKQELYRDARTTGKYDEIWQSVGKCVFCDLNDKYVFFEENGVVMTVALFAYIDGHCMIIPRRHVRSAKDLSQVEWDTMRKFTYIAKKLIRDVHDIKGVQYVLRDGGIVAQSTVSDHLHMHCLPFDSPDLSVWNYRRLKNTPLENANAYRQARKKLLSAEAKFEQKYKQPASLPMSCNVIIINEYDEVLFQERSPQAQLVPNYLTLPGGTVHDYTQTLEQELAREVYEEIGYQIDLAKVRLVASRIDSRDVLRRSPHLKANYKTPMPHLWNIYLLTEFKKRTKLMPGDDCEAIAWVKLKEVADHPRISDGTKAVFEDLKL